MRELFLKLLRITYKWFKTNPYLSRLYYDVASEQHYGDFQVHERMLADKVRNDTYHKAILKYVREGDAVIDLGAGCGILSFFAALKKPGKIYAIEHNRKILETAELVADHNGLKNIDFLNLSSKSFSPKEKVDVILHDIMGHFVLDENMVESVVDLRDRLLKPGGKILPSKFELFIEPVKIVDHYYLPFIWEQKIHNVSFECLKNLTHEIRGPHGYQFISSGVVDYSLCSPEGVLSIDLETIQTNELPKGIQYVRTVEKDGRLDGFCVYFRVIFDEEIRFSRSPFDLPTPWGQVLLRVESKDYKRGDQIELSFIMDNVADRNTYRWWYK